MAEYIRKQRNQLSGAVADNGAGSRQLKGFVDNRLNSIVQFQRINSISNNIKKQNIIQKADGLNGSFLEMPSSDLVAEPEEKFLSPDKILLGVGFSMNAIFTGERKEKGEYRQYVKGTASIDGVNENKTLAYSKKMLPDEYVEDGPTPIYGRRPSNTSSQYIKEGDSFIYKGTDNPSLELTRNQTGKIDLHFMADLIDTDTDEKLCPSYFWNVSGEYDPSHPETIKKLPDL